MTTHTNTTVTQRPSIHLALGVFAGIILSGLGFWLLQRIGTAFPVLDQMPVSLIPYKVYTVLASQAEIMGLPLTDDTQAYWYIARAGGIIAYLLLWFSTLWGILMSSKILHRRLDAILIYGMHEFIPLLAVVFVAIHMLALLGDSYINFNLISLLIPFASPYEPLWTGLGSISFLFAIALIVSTYARKHIGRRLWHAFHITAYLAFVLAFMHGIMIGTEKTQPAIQLMYIVTGSILLFLTYYRLLSYRPRANSVAKRNAQ